MRPITSLLLPPLLALAVAGCQDPPSPGQVAPDTPPAAAAGEAARYTGSEACNRCHAAQWRAWQDSHHDHSLQLADESTVLARFPDRHGATAFSRNEAGLHIQPEANGSPRQVLYTFGVTPLQQYVIAAEGGALQTFPTAWDSREQAAGGQRWFDYQAGPFPPGDPMHWTGRANRWNSMCADCHSTAVAKGYDSATRTYATTFAVEDVGCEACHGPGSLHVADPVAAPLAALTGQDAQINTCAQCHSRRAQISEGFRPQLSYFDHYAPALLSPDLYHSDGQIEDEVYVYGSFLQSPMHRAGVTCSHCHDAHSANLSRPGNATCTFCHQSTPGYPFAAGAAGDYDTPAHHLHAPGSEGGRCVACHMPARTYMGVDERRDHSFRIPRPDLAVSLGVPEPCTGCHADQTPAWAAEVLDSRFGAEPGAHFAEAFAAADAAAPEADAALAALVADSTRPVMVRASALARLAGYGRGYTLEAVALARQDEPLLRFAACQAVESLSPASRWRLLAPLLDDPLRAVRHQAVTALLPTLPGSPDYQARLLPYLEEWLRDQSLNLDQPETLTGMALAQSALGRPAAAEALLGEALHLQPSWVPGLVNLADLYRATGRDPAAGPLLEEALGLAPEQADLAYAYGLWLSRQGRLPEAVPLFERAATLAPQRRQLGYAWAIALNDSGRGEEAIGRLLSLLERWPEDPDLLLAAVTILRDQGRFVEALPLLDRLLQQRPEDTGLRRLREALSVAATTG